MKVIPKVTVTRCGGLERCPCVAGFTKGFITHVRNWRCKVSLNFLNQADTITE